MKSFRQILAEDQLDETFIGKSLVISQNRQHASHKNRLLSKLTAIQTECQQAFQFDDPEKRSKAFFKVMFEIASALKLFAEMSANTNSISTIGVLDTERVKKELQRAFPNKIKP